jgi:transcriptional regulator with XRE-family HTH domain
MSNLSSAGFAARLVATRKHRNLTFRDLGEFAGVSHTAVQLLEKGGRSPTIETCERLAVALDVRPSWLAWGEGTAPTWARE